MKVEHHEALGLRQGKFRKRTEKIAGVVFHTTGSGPWTRWYETGSYESPFDAAVHIYKHISPYSGHIVVCGQTGRIAQMAPFETCALHVGSAGGWRYKVPGWHTASKNSRWWKERWSELRSPRDFFGGRAWAPRPNDVSIGVEVAPPLSGPRDAWSQACWVTLSGLSIRLARHFDIPKAAYYFVGHSDIHPLKRSARGAPWDPCPSQFDINRDIYRLFPESFRREV